MGFHPSWGGVVVEEVVLHAVLLNPLVTGGEVCLAVRHKVDVHYDCWCHKKPETRFQITC